MKYIFFFFFVCSTQNENLTKLLIEYGTNVNKKSNEGNTPLFNAFESWR